MRAVLLQALLQRHLMLLALRSLTAFRKRVTHRPDMEIYCCKWQPRRENPGKAYKVNNGKKEEINA
jgi:hypothetical protein